MNVVFTLGIVSLTAIICVGWKSPQGPRSAVVVSATVLVIVVGIVEVAVVVAVVVWVVLVVVLASIMVVVLLIVVVVLVVVNASDIFNLNKKSFGLTIV